MSFLPVTEALQRLEYDGLVESKPRAGSRVKIPTLQEVRGSYLLREALECQVARLYTQSHSAEQHREFLQWAAELDGMIGRREVSLFDYDGLHERFHRTLSESVNCPGLALAIERVHAVQRVWFFTTSADFAPILRAEHVELMDVLSQGDADESERVMRDHIERSWDKIARQLSTRTSDGETPETPMRRTMRRSLRG